MPVLGTYYGNSENQILEFKEFYLKIQPDEYLDDDIIYDIIKTGKWHNGLDKLILDNIKYYLKIYIPKYISCYFNSQSNGKLIIGINDSGEITGIPYRGNIDIDYIRSYITELIPRYTRGTKTIHSKIKISIEKLDVSIDFLEDPVNKLIKLMHNKLYMYKSKFSKYNDAKKIWITKLSKYCVKIFNVINDSILRSELIQFIKKNNGNANIIKHLENTQEIPVTLNEEFYIRMKDKTDLIYWATSFKDYHIGKIQKIRPSCDLLPSLINSSIILSKISDMRYKLINANKDINYYLIIIDILGKENSKDIQFRLPKSDIWYKRTRVCLNSGPGCI
jgi:hypothetical protein